MSLNVGKPAKVKAANLTLICRTANCAEDFFISPGKDAIFPTSPCGMLGVLLTEKPVAQGR